MTFIFFIIFAIFLFGMMVLLSVIRGVSSLISGSKTGASSGSTFYSSRKEHQDKTSYAAKRTTKVFSDDEGEYVSYEELKD